jgi:hypothetical protein
MPTVLRIGPYRFYFWADERQEPPHIHVASAEREAKYWLTPPVLARNEGFRSGELKEIEGLIATHLELLLEAWHGFFNAR